MSTLSPGRMPTRAACDPSRAKSSIIFSSVVPLSNVLFEMLQLTCGTHPRWKPLRLWRNGM